MYVCVCLMRTRLVSVCVYAVVSCGGVAAARWAPSGTGTAIKKKTTI